MGDDEDVKVCKVVLLGESGVGKTCIIDRFINDNFEDNQKTTGIATFIAKTMTFDEFQGKSVKFEIWDTAGQEKYRSLNTIFYKDAGVAILVYDITNSQSFEEIRQYWSNKIKEFAPKDTSKKL
jgi:small GTP-binding protein